MSDLAGYDLVVQMDVATLRDAVGAAPLETPEGPVEPFGGPRLVQVAHGPGTASAFLRHVLRPVPGTAEVVLVTEVQQLSFRLNEATEPLVSDLSTVTETRLEIVAGPDPSGAGGSLVGFTLRPLAPTVCGPLAPDDGGFDAAQAAALTTALSQAVDRALAPLTSRWTGAALLALRVDEGTESTEVTRLWTQPVVRWLDGTTLALMGLHRPPTRALAPAELAPQSRGDGGLALVHVGSTVLPADRFSVSVGEESLRRLLVCPRVVDALVVPTIRARPEGRRPPAGSPEEADLVRRSTPAPCGGGELELDVDSMRAWLTGLTFRCADGEWHLRATLRASGTSCAEVRTTADIVVVPEIGADGFLVCRTLPPTHDPDVDLTGCGILAGAVAWLFVGPVGGAALGLLVGTVGASVVEGVVAGVLESLTLRFPEQLPGLPDALRRPVEVRTTAEGLTLVGLVPRAPGSVDLPRPRVRLLVTPGRRRRLTLAPEPLVRRKESSCIDGLPREFVGERHRYEQDWTLVLDTEDVALPVRVERWEAEVSTGTARSIDGDTGLLTGVWAGHRVPLSEPSTLLPVPSGDPVRVGVGSIADGEVHVTTSGWSGDHAVLVLAHTVDAMGVRRVASGAVLFRGLSDRWGPDAAEETAACLARLQESLDALQPPVEVRDVPPWVRRMDPESVMARTVLALESRRDAGVEDLVLEGRSRFGADFDRLVTSMRAAVAVRPFVATELVGRGLRGVDDAGVVRSAGRRRWAAPLPRSITTDHP